MKHMKVVCIAIAAAAGIFLGVVPARAQRVSVKKDTILVGKVPYGFVKANGQGYYVETIKDEAVIKVEPTRVYVKGKRGYMFTFVNDGKQALVGKDGRYPQALAELVIRSRLLARDGGVDAAAERKFVLAHPTADK